MRLLDLFSGIGGFALGIKQAGITIDKHYFSEVDKYAIEIYKKHFPEAIGLGSVTDISGEGLGKIDIITFGFPCQDLSVAGKREGLAGGRSGLFYEAVRLIQKLKPQTFVFENVKGLFSSNGGKDFDAVLRAIADIGLYECEWQLINTAWFLPQNRERIYFVGYLRGSSGGKVFPIEKSHEWNTEKICRGLTLRGRKKNVVGCLDTRGVNAFDRSDLDKIIYQLVLTPDRKKKRQNGRRMKEKGEPMFTLTGQDKHGVYDGVKIRRLTPLECERLQGFPDGWTEGISDTQRYKCLGNAVSVPVVKTVFERIK